MWSHWGLSGRKDWGLVFVSGMLISISEHIYIRQEQSTGREGRRWVRLEDGTGTGPSELPSFLGASRVNVPCPYERLGVGSAGSGVEARTSWRRAATSEMRKGF